MTSSAGVFLDLTAIAVGDTSATRTGSSIKPLSLHCKFSLVGNTTSVLANLVRILVVQDKQQIADTVAAPADLTSPLAFLNLASNDPHRFSYLYDKVYTRDRNSVTLTGSGRYDHYEEIYIPLSGHIYYNGTASTDIQKNGITVVAISDSAANHDTLAVNAKLVFTDN